MKALSTNQRCNRYALEVASNGKIQTYTSSAFPPETDVWMDLIAGVWAPFSLEQIKNRGGGWWNRWIIPFSYCTIYPSSSSSSSYHQIVSNTIQNRGSPDDGPLEKMRIFNIPNYEEKEYRMKRTHAHVTTTISSRHTEDGVWWSMSTWYGRCTSLIHTLNGTMVRRRCVRGWQMMLWS
jgi:hypothetical protein